MIQVASEKVTYITQKGLEKLQSELEYLQTVKRQEVADYLQETMGNVEEPEYLIAIEERAFVEGRICQLKSLLSNVQLIRPGQNHSRIVDIGSTVVLRENSGIEIETYTIVGSTEANPGSGLISNESPLGKALLGSRAGDVVEFNGPEGLLKFRVLAVQ